MTNTNCLKNIKCPDCGNEDRLRIAAMAVFMVTDDGTDDYGDVEWGDDSYAECPECHRHGTLKDFRTSARREPYFTGASGKRYTYAEIADRIRKEAPHTLGKHISAQLAAIGLTEEMMNGSTPCGLPFTFADKPRLVEKQLTSTSMIHTPGIFRAFQNDYHIKGEPRRRAVKMLSEVYGLPRAEAEGLLSGAIAIVIDEAAGTIAYSVATAAAEEA